MPKRTREYHSWRLEKLADPEIAEGYLNDALRDSPEMFLKALLNVTQARQVAVIAKKADVKRESIYRAFSGKGNPTLNTLNSVLGALGLQIKVAAKSAASQDSPHSISRSTHSHSQGYKTQRKPGHRERTFQQGPIGQLSFFDKLGPTENALSMGAILPSHPIGSPSTATVSSSAWIWGLQQHSPSPSVNLEESGSGMSAGVVAALIGSGVDELRIAR